MAIAANNARNSIMTTDFLMAATFPTMITYSSLFDNRAPGEDSSNGKNTTGFVRRTFGGRKNVTSTFWDRN